MAPGKRNGSRKLLASSRPGISKARPDKTMSSKATRTLIRSHHLLQKQLKQAQKAGDQAKAASLQAQIGASGGLEAYQKASIQGQATDRGGDSSKVLVEWLRELGYGSSRGLRMLEVGSLRVDNACASSGMFDMARIDLHSQHADIIEQDFMQRPLPSSQDLEKEGFDVVSLSLVVNYVPDAATRGDMLRRTCRFLRRDKADAEAVPALFLVLPAPCVHNSRYLDESTLMTIMQSLDYSLVKSKTTAKLVYYYFLWSGGARKQSRNAFRKKEIRQGRQMNNFAIEMN